MTRPGSDMRISLRLRMGASVGATALALVLAACSGGAPVESASPSGSAGTLDAQLRPVVTAAMSQMRVPGAIVYVSVPGQDPWEVALGTGDLATDAPMRVADHMRIGSITKTFTATVVLQLAEEGKVDLDKPATKYLPGAPTNGATVRQLLAMTSGVYNYTDAPGFLAASDADPTKVWASQELLDFARKHKPYFPPGKGFHYSNTNYIMLGMIAQRAAGKPIGDLIRERIVMPLSLTGCSYPVGTGIPDPHSQGYQFASPQQDQTSSLPSSSASADVAPADLTVIGPSMAGAAGAMICTVDDLRVWSKALATGELLSPAMQQQRLQGRPMEPGSSVEYGLGIIESHGLLGHSGSIPGFQSAEYYRPADDVTIIVLANLSAAPDGAAPADAIMSQISRTLFPTASPTPTS